MLERVCVCLRERVRERQRVRQRTNYWKYYMADRLPYSDNSILFFYCKQSKNSTKNTLVANLYLSILHFQ